MTEPEIAFFIRRVNGQLLGVYKLHNGVPQQWTVDGWEKRHFDWSGIGEDWAEYDAVEIEEACAALLELGVTPDQLRAVILGVNPNGNLAAVLGS